MTDKEYKRIQVAFDEHSIEFNNPPDKQERFGFVAIKEGKLITNTKNIQYTGLRQD